MKFEDSKANIFKNHFANVVCGNGGENGMNELEKKNSEVVSTIKENAMKVLTEKAKEYALNNDRYHNFYKAAELSGQEPLEALLGMALKHFVSCVDIIEGDLSTSYMQEKFGKAFNYCVLSIGMMNKTDDLEKIIKKTKPAIYQPKFGMIKAFRDLLTSIYTQGFNEKKFYAMCNLLLYIEREISKIL